MTENSEAEHLARIEALVEEDSAKLKQDFGLVRSVLVGPCTWMYWVLMAMYLLPKFTPLPDMGVTIWYPLIALALGVAAMLIGHRWSSRRFDRRFEALEERAEN